MIDAVEEKCLVSKARAEAFERLENERREKQRERSHEEDCTESSVPS